MRSGALAEAVAAAEAETEADAEDAPVADGSRVPDRVRCSADKLAVPVDSDEADNDNEADDEA